MDLDNVMFYLSRKIETNEPLYKPRRPRGPKGCGMWNQGISTFNWLLDQLSLSLNKIPTCWIMTVTKRQT